MSLFLLCQEETGVKTEIGGVWNSEGEEEKSRHRKRKGGRSSSYTIRSEKELEVN